MPRPLTLQHAHQHSSRMGCQPGLPVLAQHGIHGRRPRCWTPRVPSSTLTTVIAAAHSPFAALALSQPFAAPEPFAPLPSMTATMQRQVGSDLDDFFAASPFSTMRRLDDMMEQQFQQMDPFGGGAPSPFTSMQRQMRDMDRQFDRMDRQFDRMFEDMDRVQRELDADIAKGLRQLQEQQPGVRIERREEKSPGSYRYYESIQIRSGSSITTLTPAHTTMPGLFSPLLFVALVFAGAYAAVTAAFARNYDLTTYGQQSKWKLLLLWPVLALLNKPFWRQFSSALRGEKVRVQQSSVDGGAEGSSS